MFKICVYYNKKTEEIESFLPESIEEDKKVKIADSWKNKINRKILKKLSLNEKLNLSELKEKVGHSISTVSNSVKKLESKDIVKTKITYKGNKQKIITSNILFVTQNPNLKKVFKKVLSQGIWIDTDKTKEIIDFLRKNEDEFYSVEEISARTKIPVDEVKSLLNNWDSQITRSVSTFLKEPPFEKKTVFRYKKVKD